MGFARFMIGALMLSATALFAQTDPSDRPVSEVRVGLPSGAVAGSARVAVNDDSFLAVWRSEWRGGQATRLDDAGKPVDVTPIGLPLSPRFVFWNGEQWIVGGDKGWIRLTKDGALLDPQPHPFETPVIAIAEGAWSGTSLYVVARTDGIAPVLMLYTFDGAMRLKGVRQVGSANEEFAGVFTDGETAVVFRYLAGAQQLTIGATLFNANGTLLKERMLFADGRRLVSAGTRGDGSGYAIVTFNAPSHMFTAPHALHTLDRELVTRPVTELGHSSGQFFSPALPFDGTALTLVATEYGTRLTTATRFTANGTILETAQAAREPGFTVWHLYAASLRGGSTVVVQSASPTTFGPASTHVEARAGADATALVSAEPIPLDVGGFEQLTPAAASGATQSLLAWRERTSLTGQMALFATRVARDGTVLDPRSILIAAETCDESRPAVAAIGNGFLVAWYDQQGIELASVGAGGEVGAGRLVHREQRRCIDRAPLIIPGGTDALLVWLVPGSGGAGSAAGTVFGARVRGDGTVIDTVPLWLGVARGAVRGASNGTDYLVTWDNNYTRVTGGGTVLDLSGNTFLDISTAVSAAWWNGSSYSVLHRDAERLKITRIGLDGRKSPSGANVSMEQSLGTSDDPPCDGRGCSLVVASMEGQNGAAFLRALRAEDDGTTASIRWSEPVPVSSVKLRRDHTDIAPVQVPGGRLFAAYVRRDLSRPAAGALRIFIRPMEAARMRSARH